MSHRPMCWQGRRLADRDAQCKRVPSSQEGCQLTAECDGQREPPTTATDRREEPVFGFIHLGKKVSGDRDRTIPFKCDFAWSRYRNQGSQSTQQRSVNLSRRSGARQTDATGHEATVRGPATSEDIAPRIRRAVVLRQYSSAIGIVQTLGGELVDDQGYQAPRDARHERGVQRVRRDQYGIRTQVTAATVNLPSPTDASHVPCGRVCANGHARAQRGRARPSVNPSGLS